MAGFLYADPQRPYLTEIDFRRSQKKCEELKNTGGCLEFFQGLGRMTQSLPSLGSKCLEEREKLSGPQKAYFEAIKMIVQMAWGDTPPRSTYERIGNLDSHTLSLFCKLRRQSEMYFAEGSYDQLRESLLQSLKGAQELGREEVWRRSLLSVPCDSLLGY
ncbi:MAG: hypothetical protein COT74_08210 [Bdellovibrionales bacterium CG10_big_fil_rev_8_21_14_0_10_45_34]|nr:MAG: hypothetical protein COT74_08210 [Bdellovibrionales bacterium CG10_big_fil_rev_8_21_14_0_10_45_34]